MENVRNVEANTAAARECCMPARNRWLNPRNLLIGVALVGGAGALVLGWDWLAAAGLASILVAVAPCLVMCALGLCMNRMGKGDKAVAGTHRRRHDLIGKPEAETADEANMPAPGNRV